MKRIRYEAKLKGAAGTRHQSVVVEAPDLNIGFAYAAIKLVAQLTEGDEIVSLTFWIVEDTTVEGKRQRVSFE